MLTQAEFLEMLRGTRSLNTYAASGVDNTMEKELQHLTEGIFGFLKKTNIYMDEITRDELHIYLQTHPTVVSCVTVACISMCNCHLSTIMTIVMR